MPFNHLVTLLELFPDKEWSGDGISISLSITLEYILENPKLPWNWHQISRNPNITMNDI